MGGEWIKIGKFYVLDRKIGKESSSSNVFEGCYGHYPVAVKRFGKNDDMDLTEIKNYIAHTKRYSKYPHQNVVTWYEVEEEGDHVYVAMEHYSYTLHDLITTVRKGYRVNPDICSHFSFKHLQLWNADKHRTNTLLFRLMRDVVRGVVHLHKMGITNLDLRPQNVLIVKQKTGSLGAKISITGYCKPFIWDKSSLTDNATGYGHWFAPEQHGCETSKVDVFNLGCVMSFCIKGVRHPCSDSPKHDTNIKSNQLNSSLPENIPEAVDLFPRLLDQIPERMPKAEEVYLHPLFWDKPWHVQFVSDLCYRIHFLDDRENDFDLLEEVESIAQVVMGKRRWDEMVDPVIFDYIGVHSRYDFFSVCDLLRFIQQILKNFNRLPRNVQVIFGPKLSNFYCVTGYFSSRFPRLWIELYKVMCKFLRKEEAIFRDYFHARV